ncbi:hypothetical protein B0H13DRAFT_2671627 [Mycena leptocephala]|nr:hypothetical protein B0H13DRAFT_2671627 [Mycena leptocephala]
MNKLASTEIQGRIPLAPKACEPQSIGFFDNISVVIHHGPSTPSVQDLAFFPTATASNTKPGLDLSSFPALQVLRMDLGGGWWWAYDALATITASSRILKIIIVGYLDTTTHQLFDAELSALPISPTIEFEIYPPYYASMILPPTATNPVCPGPTPSKGSFPSPALPPALTHSVSPPPPPQPTYTPPAPNPAFNFRANTAASTLTRDGLEPPASWVLGPFHELLADALRFGWESGLKKGVVIGKEDGRREGVIDGRHAARAEASKAWKPPTIRKFTTAQIQTDAAAVINLSKESLPPLIVAADPIVPLVHVSALLPTKGKIQRILHNGSRRWLIS